MAAMQYRTAQNFGGFGGQIAIRQSLIRQIL